MGGKERKDIEVRLDIIWKGWENWGLKEGEGGGRRGVKIAYYVIAHFRFALSCELTPATINFSCP